MIRGIIGPRHSGVSVSYAFVVPAKARIPLSFEDSEGSGTPAFAGVTE
jgi:hypothetical protein